MNINPKDRLSQIIKLIGFTFLFLVSGQLFSQVPDSGIPEKIVHAFQKKFPSAGEISWSKANGHFKVCFVEKNQYYQVFWDHKSHIRELRLECEEDDLPGLVAKQIKKRGANVYYEQILWVEKHGQSPYFDLILETDSSHIEARIGKWGKIKLWKETRHEASARG